MAAQGDASAVVERRRGDCSHRRIGHWRSQPCRAGHPAAPAGADPTEAEVVEYRSILRTRGFTAVTPKALGKILTARVPTPTGEQQKQLEEAFSIIDEDDGVVRDGEMSRLLELLTTVGEPLTEEESEQFWPRWMRTAMVL